MKLWLSLGQKARLFLRKIYLNTIFDFVERTKIKSSSRMHHNAFAIHRNSELSRVTLYYPMKQLNFLSELCDLYGSDKGESREFGHPYSWKSHSYTDFYSRMYAHCRTSIEKVFECGIGTNDPSLVSSMGKEGKPGASLRVWRDYFPNARIFGGDIDKNILFSEHRIETYFLDQYNPQSISDYWRLVGIADFDLMIDDGDHTFEATSCLFKNSIHMLSSSGIYIIEDVSYHDLIKYRLFFAQLAYSVDYILLESSQRTVQGNCLVVIRKVQNQTLQVEM
jgi:hypothetical protein